LSGWAGQEDIVPYTPTRFDLHLGRGERALVYEKAEVAAASH
jgi:hypothetical protein